MPVFSVPLFFYDLSNVEAITKTLFSIGRSQLIPVCVCLLVFFSRAPTQARMSHEWSHTANVWRGLYISFEIVWLCLFDLVGRSDVGMAQ